MWIPVYVLQIPYFLASYVTQGEGRTLPVYILSVPPPYSKTYPITHQTSAKEMTVIKLKSAFSSNNHLLNQSLDGLGDLYM